MSAFTVTTTALCTEGFRHYGKLAGVGYSQDMEIDHDLPRPTATGSTPSVMNVSPETKELIDQRLPLAKEPGHGLPDKPPVAQDAPSLPNQTEDSEAVSALLDSTAHKPMQTPHLQQDLLALFGLAPLAATVARTDPNTGEKINKMRKSYEGKVKGFALAGRNRAVKHNHEKSMGLLQMAQWPEEEWHNQKVHGRDVRSGLSEATMQKLGLAMQMQPGPVPNTADHDWDDLLGNEKVKPLPTIDEPSKKSMRPNPNSRVNGQPNGIRPPGEKTSTTEANRPKRVGKKRRYDDHSFEGYGEGYLDDDGDVIGDLGGYSSDDGSRKGGPSKKRRKEYASPTPPGLGDRRGSYGIGMLGVGSGIGAYGR
ncbi:MAG: hypothetical protein Q9222_001065 [Ikaeria aurantiellina]